MTKRSAVLEKPAKTDEPLLSMTGERIDGALPPPKDKTICLAKDMESDELYVNLHPQSIGSPYKMFRTLGYATGGVKVTFYADHMKQWITVVVDAKHKFTTDETYLQRMAKPVEESRERRKAKTAHLQKFQKTKPDPVAEVKDGKRVFKGKLGAKNFLFDAGDGSTVTELEEGKPAKDVAAGLKRKVVGQGEVTAYALWVFTKQWKEARSK